MKNYTIFLKSIVDIKNFVDKIKDFDFEITIESDGTVVSAKSIMSVLALNLTKPVLVCAYSDIEDAIKDFIV